MGGQSQAYWARKYKNVLLILIRTTTVVPMDHYLYHLKDGKTKKYTIQCILYRIAVLAIVYWPAYRTRYFRGGLQQQR